MDRVVTSAEGCYSSNNNFFHRNDVTDIPIVVGTGCTNLRKTCIFSQIILDSLGAYKLTFSSANPAAKKGSCGWKQRQLTGPILCPGSLS